jgi:alpha-tubulin suppressor-like RCC1 family protein
MKPMINRHAYIVPAGLSRIIIAFGIAAFVVNAIGAPSGTVTEWGVSVLPLVEPDTRFIAVAAGATISLALKDDGTILQWGNNAYGQCTAPRDLRNVIAIAAGDFHSLALKSDGTVVAWGYNAFGITNVPTGLANIVAVAAGLNHSLALRNNGTVAGWGSNLDAAGNRAGQSAPPRGLSDAVAIAAGDFHSLALTGSGTVVAWGNSWYGQTNVPEGLSNVIAIAAGTYHSLALKSDGTVVAWGANTTWGRYSGQSTVPYGLNRVIAIAAGGDHSLALRANGTVVAWGSNDHGESTVPPTLTGIAAISAGTAHNLALSTNGNLLTLSGHNKLPTDLNNVTAVAGGCYGSPIVIKSGGVLASLDRDNAPAVNNLVEVASGYPDNLLLQADGSVLRWRSGPNDGDLLLPFYAYFRSGPGPVTNAIAVAAGEYHTIVLTSDGTVLNSYFSLLGEISDITNVTAIAAGAGHGLALKADGTVVAWGANSNGQTNVPEGLSNVVAIAGGGFHSLALKSDGTVVAWGGNVDVFGHVQGQLDVPSGLSNVVAIAAGNTHSLALKSDGTIVAWGDNGVGQIRVPDGLSNVVAIAAGGEYNLALVVSPPCVLTPNPLTACNDPGQCGATVHFAPPFSTNCEQALINCVPPPGSFFPVGTNTVLCTAITGSEDVASCAFDVIVNDCEEPVIHSVTALPNLLWPPNHQMQNVTLQVSSTDNCHVASTRIVHVTSNEPSDRAHGRGSPDWEVTGELTLKLRADRSANGRDRVYSITVLCSDDSGNASTAIVRVSVPHEDSNHGAGHKKSGHDK